MWLTGFDVPCLHTMYIDKKLQGANLMQAIARVNRVYKDKLGGLIVDYIGIGQELKIAMGVYSQSGGRGKPIQNLDAIVSKMEEKMEVVQQMFHDKEKQFDYRDFFATTETKKKLQILLKAKDFILRTEETKKRFLKEATSLFKLFAMAVPHKSTEKIREKIVFFQTVKSGINKLTKGEGKSNFEVETALKQIVEKNLFNDGVTDIFEWVGLQKPVLNIFSDEFLLEVKNMPHKNIAFELLRKLINDEIKIRQKKNIFQAKKLSEMLQSIIAKYHNNQITSAELIEELCKISQTMNLEDKKAKDLNLTEEEYAFYTVLKQNSSTEFLKDEKMKELIHEIINTVHNNATVDWYKREDVRARLRVTVKKILTRYGYPPDLARMQSDKVLEQSEMLAGRIVQTI